MVYQKTCSQPCNLIVAPFCKVLLSQSASFSQRAEALLKLMDTWATLPDPVHENIYAHLCPTIKNLLDDFWLISKPQSKSNGIYRGNRFYYNDNFVPGNTRNGKNWKQLVDLYKADFNLRVDGGVEYNNQRINLKPYAVASVEINYAKTNLQRGASVNSIQEIGAVLFEKVLRNEIQRGGYKSFWEYKDGIQNDEFVRDTPLVIHEDYDCKTLMLVPKLLHDNWSHYGGVALANVIYKNLY